jgi:hypothetical protein
LAKERNAPRKTDKPQPDEADRRRRFTWEDGDVRVIRSGKKREATVPKQVEEDNSLDSRAFDIAYGDGTVDERIRKLQDLIAEHPGADAEGARGYFEMFAMQKSALERTD